MTERKRDSIAAVSPRDCALGIAVPLTREDFLNDLGAPEQKDFVQHVRRANDLEGASDEFYWSSVYAPIAGVVERACAAVARLGVDVQQRMTLAGLRTLFERHKVLTLVAHWKFAKVTPSDVIDPRQFLATLAHPGDPLQVRAAGAIIEKSPHLLDCSESETDDALRQRIAYAIRPVIAAAHAAYRRPDEQANDTVGEPQTVDLRRVTRVVLEEAFPASIRPAPAIELSDGMHTVADFIGAIPPSFEGVLDMTICNSVIVGAAVKRARPDCLVAVNRYPAEMHVRMTFYGLAIESLARRPARYIDVLTDQRKD
jgi:hypothetical protein